MVTTIGGPRVLLRQLRETMAEPLASQDRLDKIVTLIATNMHTDVCSFYVLRDDGALELFATFGLKRESVHMTTLRLGEGLVGLIAAQAEPLALEDAPSHPAFAYRPETGEDPFFAFLGVPVLRAGQTLGVLVVQNRERRAYGEDETEALLTTATILAEFGADVTDLFNNLTGLSRQRSFRRLLIAPHSLRARFLDLVEREIGHATAGRPAGIILKLNAIVDVAVIEALYRASGRVPAVSRFDARVGSGHEHAGQRQRRVDGAVTEGKRSQKPDRARIQCVAAQFVPGELLAIHEHHADAA